MMSDYNVDTSSRFPIKAWTKGVQVEDVAADQLRNIANMPFIHKGGVYRAATGTWEEFGDTQVKEGPPLEDEASPPDEVQSA